MYTAGKYKRTVTMLGENTEEGRQKFTEDLEDTHVLFKDFVAEHRQQIDIESVATGEVWFGQRALGKQLVDQLQTSDEYLYALAADAELFAVEYEYKVIPEKLGIAATGALETAFTKAWSVMSRRFMA